MKKYTEIGIGNTWFVRTEIEEEDGTENERRGTVHLSKVDDVYLRVWLGHKVFIVSSNEGIKSVRKSRKAFKILFGIIPSALLMLRRMIFWGLINETNGEQNLLEIFRRSRCCCKIGFKLEKPLLF